MSSTGSKRQQERISAGNYGSVNLKQGYLLYFLDFFINLTHNYI